MIDYFGGALTDPDRWANAKSLNSIRVVSKNYKRKEIS